MNKKVLHISRQFLIGVIALQFLNMSVDSDAYWDCDYDYSYSYNKNYDPTETALELIIEMKYGQQQAFTYAHHEDTKKNISSAFHLHTDLQVLQLTAPKRLKAERLRSEEPAEKIPSATAEIISPPPETIPA